jgi:hypothetical protein
MQFILAVRLIPILTHLSSRWTVPLNLFVFVLFVLSVRLDFKFFRGSDGLIMQKVYLLRLMPVCFGLKMLAANFCHSCGV